MKLYPIRVSIILVVLLVTASMSSAQEQVAVSPDLPLVRITGDILYQPEVQPQSPRYDVPLARITGDTEFDKREIEWHIVGDVPPVIYTGDVRPGLTIVLSQPRKPAQPIVVGDPNLESMKLVAAFTESHDVRFFAEDARLLDMSLSTTLKGREEIAGFLQNYYGDMGLFRTGYEEPQRVIAQDESMIICESIFYGTAMRRDGSLAKALLNPLTVEVPMLSVFEIENGEIVSTRLYYNADNLLNVFEMR